MPIKQKGLPLHGHPILLITCMITDGIGLHSVILPLFMTVAFKWYFKFRVLLPEVTLNQKGSRVVQNEGNRNRLQTFQVQKTVMWLLQCSFINNTVEPLQNSHLWNRRKWPL